MSKLFHEKFKINKCLYCLNSKNWFKGSCYCIKYGIIITYGKEKCNGLEYSLKKSQSDGGKHG